MKLSERLSAVKAYVPRGIAAADIGADRGELSLALLREGIVEKMILSDISSKSLARAKALFADREEEKRSEFRVGNGLKVLSPGEVDYAILAGMGGLTICEILEAAAEVVSSLSGLILQAMGNSDKVRETLLSMGFVIVDETMLWEDGQYYTIIHGVPGEGDLDETELFAGASLLKKKDPVLKRYLEEERTKAREILTRLEKSGEGISRQQELKAYLRRIAEAESRMEEKP